MSLKHELAEKGKLLEPVLIIGKNGLNESVVKEIKLQLKKKKLIKVKYLRNALGDGSRKEFANKIAEETDSELINAVGLVVVLKKR